jgi:hypothetical protein
MVIGVLGVGNVHLMGPIVLALAGHFGERPLDIFFWDPDDERLDLADRLARVTFKGMKNPHCLRSTTDFREFELDITHLIVAADEKAWNRIDNYPFLHFGPSEKIVLNGSETPLLAIDWPEIKGEKIEVTYQVLRWVNGEEYVANDVENQGPNPLSAWLKTL